MPDKMNTNLACRAGRIRNGNCVRSVCRGFTGGEGEIETKQLKKTNTEQKTNKLGYFFS